MSSFPHHTLQTRSVYLGCPGEWLVRVDRAIQIARSDPDHHGRFPTARTDIWVVCLRVVCSKRPSPWVSPSGELVFTQSPEWLYVKNWGVQRSVQIEVALVRSDGEQKTARHHGCVEQGYL